MRELSGKTAVVIGGASGLGIALARALVREGMSVVITSRSRHRVETAVKTLAASSDADAVRGTVADVTNLESLTAAAEYAERVFGSIHVVCNNAGVNVWKNVVEATTLDWDYVMQTNLRGVSNAISVF